MDVLLVDDHPEVRSSLCDFLQQLGHRGIQASSGEEALRLVSERRPGLVVSDLRMPGMSGLELLNALEELDQPPPFVLMTAFGDANTAVMALRHGALDYLRKPIDVRELHRLVERVVQSKIPESGAHPIHEDRDGLLVVDSELERLVALADRLHAASDMPCLIEGETGTGKELFARRIHHGGKPAAGPFIALNCAAISTGLFEAELFGYAAGAFTGASPGGAMGKLELAAGGTIFLDEIGDLPTDQQAKLLRLLEDRTWYPVGSTQLKRLTARVVCATNAGLLGQVHSRKFREDLYYRLKVGHMRLPTIRERPESLVPLARGLVRQIAARRGRSTMKLSSEALAYMAGHAWPGNVREMLHVLEQCVVLESGAVIDRQLVAQAMDAVRVTPPVPVTAPTMEQSAGLRLPRIPPAALMVDANGLDLDAWLRALVAAALAQNDDSPVRTATYLGISRKVLYTLRKRYRLLATLDDSQAEGQ